MDVSRPLMDAWETWLPVTVRPSITTVISEDILEEFGTDVVSVGTDSRKSSKGSTDSIDLGMNDGNSAQRKRMHFFDFKQVTASVQMGKSNPSKKYTSSGDESSRPRPALWRQLAGVHSMCP